MLLRSTSFVCCLFLSLCSCAQSNRSSPPEPGPTSQRLTDLLAAVHDGERPVAGRLPVEAQRVLAPLSDVDALIADSRYNPTHRELSDEQYSALVDLAARLQHEREVQQGEDQRVRAEIVAEYVAKGDYKQVRAASPEIPEGVRREYLKHAEHGPIYVDIYVHREPQIELQQVLAIETQRAAEDQLRSFFEALASGSERPRTGAISVAGTPSLYSPGVPK